MGSGSRLPIHRMSNSTSSCSSLPLSTRSSLGNRPVLAASTHIRWQSSGHSTAPLHPTSTASAAVAGSAISPNDSGSKYVFHPYADPRANRARTILPIPLPSNVLDQRKSAFKKQVVSKQHQRRKAKETDTTKTSALEDLDEATMQSLNQNDTYFTSGQTAEELAILRACLATGLIHRATKVFDMMREDVAFRIRNSGLSSAGPSTSKASTLGQFASPLDVGIYNEMLGAIMRRGFQEDTKEGTKRWMETAWQLFHDMERGVGKDFQTLVDPIPDEGTYAVMLRGLVRLRRSSRLSYNVYDMTHLLGSLRRSGLRLRDIFIDPVFSREDSDPISTGGMSEVHNGELDERSVLQALGSVVAEMGDLVLSSELEEISRLLQGRDAESKKTASVSVADLGDSADADATEELAELLPVGSTRKNKLGQETESEVNYNLQILRENLSIVQEAKKSSAEPYERQHWLEFGAMDAARKRFEAGEVQMSLIGMSNAGKLQKKDLQRWMWSWYKKLQTALTKDIQRLIETESQKAPLQSIEAQVLPFLQLLPPSKLAMMTILELMRLHATSTTDGMKTAHAVVQIGKAVEREHFVNLLRKDPKWLAKKRAAQNKLHEGGLSNYQLRRELAKSYIDDPLRDAQTITWTTNIRARVGSYLIQQLMEVATVKRSAKDRDGVKWDEEQPAFYSAYQYVQGKRLGVLRLNDVVRHRLARDNTMDTLHPRHLPMLVPPNPWIRYDSGGYLSVKTKALRFKNDFEQASYLKAASEDGSLESVLTGLDVLGSTAWTINKDIFKVVSEVWNSGKAIADMPPLDNDEAEPIRPDNYDTDMRARADYLYRLKMYNQEKASDHSQRCEVNYRLEIARAFMGERFYFPHNMDFRGRAYPIPPHLNHIGNDVSRGLLLFADGKVLGESGLRWLRIHLANVYGYDKASFSERVQFAVDHEEDMRKSVANPLGEGGDWWLKADDPWQCLATCMELVKALDHPEGPEQYVSQLPVHQDGTCNGLQHYAALGGDMAGAEQVNLKGGDRPSDVYTAVSDAVIEEVKLDAKQGLKAAILLDGMIARKVVKQTVMTTVYGVTFVGAKNQIAKQLSERGLAAEVVWETAAYLAKKVLYSIGDLFAGAESIQRWLKDSALLIARSIPPERLHAVTAGEDSETGKPTLKTGPNVSREMMTSVIWTTPLGLPVVQPYRKDIRKQIKTSLQTIFIQDPNLASQVSPSKQASAFPPNFIHSLDATHMFLTALECQSAGLTFASVHDSYWTHACDIETMSDIIRDTFVRLHSCDILPKLHEEVSTLVFSPKVV